MRTKFGVVLAIPAVAFVVVAAVQAGLSLQQAAALDGFAAQVAASDAVTELAHELQYERDWLVGQLAAAAAAPAEDRDRGELDESVAAARDAVAGARTAFDRAVEPLRERDGLVAAVTEAGSALDGLDLVHSGVAEGWLREQAVFDGYTRAIEATLALLPTPLAVEDTDVGGYRELADAKELTAQIRGQLHALISAGGFRPGERERMADLRAQRRSALDRFRQTATPGQLGRFDDVVRGQAVRGTARLEQAALDQAALDRAGSTSEEVTPQQWWQAATTELELYREVEVAVLADVDSQVARASRDRWRQAALVSAAALLTLVVSLVLSVGIGRSMVRSLWRLRRQAVDVAQVRLPGLLERLRTARASDPIVEPPVPTMAAGADEVGEVGEAFTQVHRSAVRLAVQQAQMRTNVNRIFVNLARRSQTLVERQLAVLDALERDETDPAQLANLFQLDHLATRMRRNNDSLLVLTAADPARRYDHPLPLSSVARAAIAEIERFQRVRDEVAEDLYVVGYAVVDLAHLLAELLDNATAFSDPERLVRLTGQRAPAPRGSQARAGERENHWGNRERDAGRENHWGALVEITDAGIGMSAAALQEANRLLANPPVIDVATSQRMGLVVVGQLAARHGLRVRLAAAAPGTTAAVWLPQQLLAAPADKARPAPPAGAELTPAMVRGPRRTPARAEDVLGEADAIGEAYGTGAPESIWWSRPATPDPDGAGPGNSRGAVPARPVEHRVSAAGLPIRVPMAQVPPPPGAQSPPPPGAAPAPRRPAVVELDPHETGDLLSAFYGAVHRAETDTDDDASAHAAGPISGGA